MRRALVPLATALLLAMLTAGPVFGDGDNPLPNIGAVQRSDGLVGRASLQARVGIGAVLVAPQVVVGPSRLQLVYVSADD